MILYNDISLIGDSLGTVPITIQLAKLYPDNFSVYFINEQIADMIPKKYNINFLKKPPSQYDFKLEISEAFLYAENNRLHMTQAYFHQCNLLTPPTPIKPELEFSEYTISMDFNYMLAPFSRSLPENQKWPQENWNQLVKEFSDKKFLLFGNSSHDSKEFIQGPNVQYMFDEPLERVAYVMKNSRAKLLSVVTGLSHMSYALDVPIVLLWGQSSPWGDNPDAIHLNGPVVNISVEAVKNALTDGV